MSTRPILIMAGGTGGHVYPGIALAEELRARHPDLNAVHARARELCEQLGDPDGAVSRYEEAQLADARDVVVLRALRRHAVSVGITHSSFVTRRKHSSLRQWAKNQALS